MRYFSYLHKSWHAGVVTLLGMMLYPRQGLSNTHTLASILFEKKGVGGCHIYFQHNEASRHSFSPFIQKELVCGQAGLR